MLYRFYIYRYFHLLYEETGTDVGNPEKLEVGLEQYPELL